ncbi:acetylornithine aminotransferase apoenzyme [Thermosyntropha lipolytica DSM 11003]|uniref:Acetylornithine aminotransferase n=1 Tax=Thermosyntropha lipolytica DSM 11003 TaxID=1123382 RepID=A0A1M5KLU8_9FIRM|nr:acetylornithine transaminase [Thermosyntropha lipolytica]SHG53173.1 acetylornithine aminotransferase apoenzyme [Thermosyntropha lipolytica DSM 11003]
MTNQAIIDKGKEHIMATYARLPVALVKGKGSYVVDADGKQYLDFVAGIATCSLGHCHEELVKTVQEQSQKLWHVSNLYWIEPQVELASKLTRLSGLDKVFFCNSGAEANEGAIKLARKYFYRQNKPERNRIIVFKNSFHGRTMGALTATGQAKYHEGFAPLLEGFLYAEYNNIMSVESLIDDTVAGIMVEPIQGEGGIRPADLNFLRSLRQICDREGILLILDEVQTGVGRTGKFFAFEHYGVKPDILTLAKGLGGGFPIGAMLATEKAASGFAPGDHASTFGGNPLACAVGGKVVDIVAKEEFLREVEAKGEILREALMQIGDSRIKEIRGKGLILGVEWDREVKGLIDICRQKGLLLIGAGPNVVRLVPPLTVNRTEINQAVNIFKEALKIWQE